MKRKNEHDAQGYGHRIPLLIGKRIAMRLTATVCILTTAIVSGFAARSAAQLVSINRTQASLQAVFNDIREQTGYSAVIPMALLDRAEAVTLKADQAELREVLDQLRKQTGYTFTMPEGKKIILVDAPSSSRPTSSHPDKSGQALSATESNGSLLILAFPEVRGFVVDSINKALSGASIRVLNVEGKRTSLQKQTDHLGFFHLTNVPDDASLEISYIGYVTQVIKVDRPDLGFITMRESPSTLDEVIINKGYYTESKRLSTGNVAQVTAAEISDQPVSNPFQAIQGRMSGVEIVQQSGIPGAGMKIQIRGQNSLRNTPTDNGNLPLYVIDGMPVNSAPLRSFGNLTQGIGIDPLNTINPANIESIEILKDADATSIYGSRGANGVVLITTKKGAQGALTADFNVKSGVGMVSNMIDLLTTQQYLEMRREAFANDNAVPNANSDFDLLVWDTTRYTNWQKELYGHTSNVTDAQLSLSAGNANTSFRFGGGLYKETTVFPGDFGYNRASGLLNVNHHTSDKRLNISLSLNYGVDRNKLFSSTVVNHALQLAPNAPKLHDDLGNLNWENSTWTNPLSGMKNTQSHNSSNLVVNTVLSYKLFPDLEIKSNLGYTTLNRDETVRTPKSGYDPAIQDYVESQTFLTTNNSVSWIIEPQINYTKTISKGTLDILVGSTWQDNINQLNSLYGYGYVSEDLLDNIGAADDVAVNRSDNIHYRYNAIFGRIGFNWNGTYIVNMTARRDGSSRFGPDNQFANFASVGAAWIFSNEPFIKDQIPFLSFGKLRTSYGSTGSDQIGDYGYLDTYGPTTFTYQGIKGLIPTSLPNPDYRWEVNHKFEAGFESGFANDRIQFSASWYHNRSSNQLVGYNLPVISGFPTVIANLPATVENQGWEFDLRASVVQSKTFKWMTSANVTIPKNKLVSFPNIEGSAYARRYVVGMPLNMVRLYRSQGVDPLTGVYQIEDVNQDGNFSLDDQVITKVLGRNFYGGLHNVLNFKSFEVDFLFEFVKQNGTGSLTAFGAPGFSPSLGGNQPVSVMGRWRKEGDVATIQKFSQTFSNYLPYNRKQNSDLNIDDASFVRLKNITVSYTIPPLVLKTLKSVHARVYASAQNIFTWTPYAGLDPQSPGNSQLPVLKMFVAGVQIKL